MTRSEIDVKSENVLLQMDSYGSIWLQMKTGQSHMAQDHFWNPLDRRRAYKITKMACKTHKVSITFPAKYALA